MVRGGGPDRLIASFKPGNYVLLKQVQEDTLHAPAGPHILRMVESKPSRVAMLESKPCGMAMLESNDAARNEEREENIEHSSLPILYHNMYLERLYRSFLLHRRVYGMRRRVSKMMLCDTCNQGYHL